MDKRSVRAALEARRGELAAELGRLTEVPKDPMPSVSFGKRVGDGTTEAVERLNKVAAAESLTETARRIDRALEKLAEGSYGICDRCGRRIPEERLEAIPWTAQCVSCSGSRRAPQGEGPLDRNSE